jgi:hypothetical protein
MKYTNLSLVIAIFSITSLLDASPKAGNDQNKNLKAFIIPVENKDEAKKPDFSSVQKTLNNIINAINTDNPEDVVNEFFPKGAFNQLKDIRFPDRYHKKLLKWFFDDIKREHGALKGKKIQFISFQPGRCKFKKIGTEYNKIAYWSCYGSRFVVSLEEENKGDESIKKNSQKNSQKTKTIKIKALINWGPKWFITHLGPIPTSD